MANNWNSRFNTEEFVFGEEPNGFIKNNAFI